MKRLILALSLLTAPAYAVDAPPQINPTDTFAITLNATQWNAVLASVRDSEAISAHDGNTLVDAIQQQVSTQLKQRPSKKR